MFFKNYLLFYSWVSENVGWADKKKKVALKLIRLYLLPQCIAFEWEKSRPHVAAIDHSTGVCNSACYNSSHIRQLCFSFRPIQVQSTDKMKEVL